MSIMLGNLTVEQIENRLGIELTDDERILLKQSRQQEASNIKPDRWHCFDMPFTVVCGSYETASKINDILSPYSKQMTGQLTLSIIEVDNA